MTRSRVSRSRAFTLSELTVYGALLGVLLTGTYAALSLSMRYFMVARAATDLQSQAQQTVLHLVSELADTTGASLYYTNQSNMSGILFLSPRDRLGNFKQDTGGNIVWQKWVCYRWDRLTGNLSRMASYLSPPTITPTACPYSIATFPATAEVVIWRDMKALTFSGTDSIKIQARFEQAVLSSSSGVTDNRVDIVDSIKFRN